MTWNPLKKTYLTNRPTLAYPAVSQDEDKQLDLLFRNLQSVEDSNRRLQKEMKRYLEAVSNAEKAELKLTSDLSSSILCHENSNLRKLVEDYHSVAAQKSEGASELLRVSQRTFLEPLKKFGGEFSGLAAVLNSHEQLVQEWKNIATRVKKLEERGDRMPNTIVKLEKEKQNLIAAAEAISSSHRRITEEFPVFFNKRIDYIQPTLQAMVRAQLDYHGNTTRCFTILVPSGPVASNSKDGKLKEPESTARQVSPSLLPESQFQSIIQSKFADIHSLSIVKNSSN
ncbi:bridging integrator 3 isoform X1 [Frankliniella occidentalis]|uniref:Bridging integrator 3 isoform X1 n=1 Tax=Frankliniella occidentalis TaxID=133901 RepID=A0A6J1SJX5_FRAOC|nr:bridging integrator 3 isoform X1 [Frankliniella occidentalis]